MTDGRNLHPLKGFLQANLSAMRVTLRRPNFLTVNTPWNFVKFTPGVTSASNVEQGSGDDKWLTGANYEK
jgi:hypothetical protein